MAESADEGRIAKEQSKNLRWYLLIGGTLLAIAYVTFQLIYLLPALRA
ncbi:MAG TPA: hypothetical protein VFV14_08590 [Myxococcaceae bacterium]|nr:hypothetical protein [Myxococcaceae bacterium]